MRVRRPGISALGTRSDHHLEFEVTGDAAGVAGCGDGVRERLTEFSAPVASG